MPSNQLQYSSVCKSQSPTCSTRWVLISWCRIQGSSGDNHARISALSSALLEVYWLDTWLNVLNELVLKELLLRELLFSPARVCDISIFWLLLEGGRFNTGDSENGFLSKVESINRAHGAEKELGFLLSHRLCGEHLAQSTHPECRLCRLSSAT